MTGERRGGRLAGVREHLALAARYMGASVRSQMQYRASFAMLSVAQLMITGIEFLGIWVLFGRFGNLRGWTLPEIAILYGIVHIAFALAEAAGRGFDLFPTMVRTGDFDRLLVRPRSTAFQIAVQELQLMRVGRLAQGLIALGWGVAVVPGVWTPLGIVTIVAGIGSGVAVFYGLFVLQATAAFWTIETLEIMNTMTYGGTEAAQYPLSIYRRWMRLLFTFAVPLACANYLPAGYLLGRPVALGPWVIVVCPIVGASFLAVCLRLWRFGERHYVSTGS